VKRRNIKPGGNSVFRNHRCKALDVVVIILLLGIVRVVVKCGRVGRIESHGWVQVIVIKFRSEFVKFRQVIGHWRRTTSNLEVEKDFNVIGDVSTSGGDINQSKLVG
jgi:hypothetical protein